VFLLFGEENWLNSEWQEDEDWLYNEWENNKQVEQKEWKKKKIKRQRSVFIKLKEKTSKFLC